MTASVRRFARSRLNWIAGKRKGWLFRPTVESQRARSLVCLITVSRKKKSRTKMCLFSEIHRFWISLCVLCFPQNCRTSCCPYWEINPFIVGSHNFASFITKNYYLRSVLFGICYFILIYSDFIDFCFIFLFFFFCKMRSCSKTCKKQTEWRTRGFWNNQNLYF